MTDYVQQPSPVWQINRRLQSPVLLYDVAGGVVVVGGGGGAVVVVVVVVVDGACGWGCC